MLTRVANGRGDCFTASIQGGMTGAWH